MLQSKIHTPIHLYVNVLGNKMSEKTNATPMSLSAAQSMFQQRERFVNVNFTPSLWRNCDEVKLITLAKGANGSDKYPMSLEEVRE